MKTRLVALLVVVFALGLSGCESLSQATSGVREKFAARDEARTKTFAAAPRPVYDAVKQAATSLGYRFVRGGPAQGEFEGVSGVAPGEAVRTARQITIRVQLHATLDGSGTDVSVRFSEIFEADSSNRPGMATETTMRDTPLYEVFFRGVQQALAAPQAADHGAPVAR